MAKNSPTRRKKSSSKSSSQGPISALLNLSKAVGSMQGGDKDQNRRVIGWILLFASLISLIACISYYFTGNADQSTTETGILAAEEINNWLGFVGAKLADLIIRRGFGIFGLVLPLYGIFFSLVLLENDYYDLARKALKYLLFLVLFGSVFLSYFEILSNATSFDLGGGFGYAVNQWFFGYIGRVGVAFLLLLSMILFAVINFNAELKASRLIENLRFSAQQAASNVKARQKTNRPVKKGKPSGVVNKKSASKTEIVKTAEEVSTTTSDKKETPQLGSEVNLSLKEPTKKDLPKEENTQLELTIVETKDEPVVALNEPKVLEQIGDDNIGVVAGEDRVEKIVPEKDQEIENIEDLDWEDFDPTLELSDFERPAFELLEDHGSGAGREVNRDELNDNKNKIVQTLEDYGIKITSIKATIGPTVTLYEIVPAPGVRISKIKNLEDDIALNLAALGIRIIAPIPGKGTIGIEVPNSKPETVSLRGVLTTEKWLTTKAELPIAIGRTISNEVFIADLNKMPHLLIAGATGQGKSVGLNTIIASLLYKKHPAEVKFVMIDPKKVELSLFSAIKNHYLATLPDQEEEPIITDVREAVNVLKSLCIEMDRRYDLLKKARVRNLKEYNTKFTARKLNPRKGHEYMPYIVLIIDELADMMMVAGKEVEMPIARLAQLARAVGIHLVIATQRPSVNVITGIIKANFPARMSYRVISKVDSRTILDANGADQLIGRGDTLLSTGSDLIRIQNAFIDTPEVERIVDNIARQRGFPEPYYLPETPSEDGGGMDDDEPFEKDSRFEEAARLIVRYQIGSASLIQRKMKLGYNRAGRIIDQLERAGVVGPHSGSKARDVLVQDEAELERYLSSI
ncbi:MAG: DNA translocase FtsK [Bacteroidota bacterium]